jgi:hypothetical protein
MTKKAKIYSNDSSNPITELSIKAQSNSPDKKLQIDPAGIQAGNILTGKGGKYSMNLTNLDSNSVTLNVVNEPSKQYIKSFAIGSQKLTPDQSTAIDIILQDKIPLGDFLTCVTLEIKNRPDTRVTVPITGKVVDNLTQSQ